MPIKLMYFMSRFWQSSDLRRLDPIDDLAEFFGGVLGQQGMVGAQALILHIFDGPLHDAFPQGIHGGVILKLFPERLLALKNVVLVSF